MQTTVSYLHAPEAATGSFKLPVRFLAVGAQLALLAALIRILNLENQAFSKQVTVAVCAGFVVHHFLPRASRLPFFAGLSVVSVFLVFDLGQGGPLERFAPALWLCGIALGMIGLCHLPIRFGARIVLLLLAGGALAALRKEWGPLAQRLTVPNAIWPILGSMLMFRLAAYLYDLKHKSAPFSVSRAVAYCFMLPNVCFPLFPVVDYKTFCKCHYNDDPIRIYQVGLKWIFRGVVQLAFYRLIYQNWVISPLAATDALSAGQYILTTFLLYLRISGTFHVIIGMLHLFGFNLPETHHLYLISSSFTDFWRRINIYWKDFIQKLVFYPLFFRMKPLGEGLAIAIATVLAFLATWILHQYQWFWIRGTFPIGWHDFYFWMGLGVLVVINTCLERRRGRRRSIAAVRMTAAQRAVLALKIAATFTAIIILWTLWSTPDKAELFHVARMVASATPKQALILLAVPVAVGIAGAALAGHRREHVEGRQSRNLGPQFRFWRSAAAVAIPASVLLAMFYKPDPRVYGETLSAILTDLRSNRLNRNDAGALEHGYYADLGDPTRFDNELWRALGVRPKDWHFNPLIEDTNDIFVYVHTPSASATFRGATFTTNRWGLRDREYADVKPEGVVRLVIVGASHEVGVGVENGESYENLAEAMLNAQGAVPGGGVEILNASVAGYTIFQRVAIVESRPYIDSVDGVLLVIHDGDFGASTARGLALLNEKGVEPPSGVPAQTLARAGVKPSEALASAVHKLEPLTRDNDALVRWAMERVSEECRRRGIPGYILLLERPEDERRPVTFDRASAMARELGLGVIDLYSAYRSVKNRASICVAPWDKHPNVEGHRLLAERFVAEVRRLGVIPATPAASEGGS